jgi:putative ATPase
MKDLGYGRDYLYPHDYEDALVGQTYFPEQLKGRRYYEPKNSGYEMKFKEFLEKAGRMRGEEKDNVEC